MSLADELQNMSDEDLGRLAAPSSEKLGFFSKLGNALAGRRGLGGDLFGTDSESIGRQIRSQLIAREAAADFDDKRSEKNKKREISLKFDKNGDGKVTFKEMPASEQRRLRDEGFAPTKEENISDQVLGPTRPLFTDLAKSSEDNKGLIPDEFGGRFGSTRDIGLSEFGDKAMGQGGNDLLSALVNDGGRTGLNEDIPGLQRNLDPQSSRDVETLVRQFDPGLQASQEVEDSEGLLPDAVLMQSLDAVNTDLRTPKSQSPMIPKDLLADSMRTVLRAAGIDDEQSNALIAGLPEGLPPSSADNLVSNVRQIATTTMKEQQKNQRIEINNDRQDQRIMLRGDLQKTLQETGKALDLKNNLAVKQVIFEHAEALQTGRLDATRTLSEERDARQMENKLSILSKQQSFTREEHELNRAASYGVQVLRGEQALDLEGARQLGRLALQDKRSGDSSQDATQKFYLDFMKKNPAIASDMLDILSQSEDIDPFTDKAIRGALAKRVQEIVDSQVVSDRIRVTADTDIYGNTMVEKMSSLHAAKIRFLQGDPVKGVPPMTPEQLKPIDEQIEAMQAFTKAGSPSTNIKVDINEKPMGAQDAGAFSAMVQANQELTTIEKLLFNEDGSINRKNILTSSEISLPFTDTTIAGMPFTEGRQLRQSLRNAIQARIRAETGQGAQLSELVRREADFLPSNLDSEEAVRDKWDRIKGFIQGSISLTDPVGTQRSRASNRTPIESLKEPASAKEFNQRYGEIKKRNPQWSEEKIFQYLSDEEGF